MPNIRTHPSIRKPASASELLAMIGPRFDDLSRQLKLIARYVEANQGRLGIDGVQETAERCGVQPSAVIRFAKQFGLSGFSEMQALFRDEAVRQLPLRGDYSDRIRSWMESGGALPPAARIAADVIRGSIDSLQALENDLDTEALDRAVALLVEARSLWLVAARRSFPVAAYLAYALQNTDKPIHWLNGLGHMQHNEMRAMGENDVMIATSFDPYAQETLEAVEAARLRGAKVVAITDSQFSPLAKHASATLLVQDSAPYGFRSLAATLCLAQALFIVLAYRMESASAQNL